MVKRVSQEEREFRAMSLASERGHEFIGWVDGYKNKESKMAMKCIKHGFFYPTPCNYERKGINGCKKCNQDKNRESNPSERIKSLLPNHIKFIGFVGGEYINQNSRVILDCENHGESIKKYAHVIHSQTLCNKCTFERPSKLRLIESEYVNRIGEICHKNKIFFVGIDGDYLGANETKIKLQCLLSHKWSTTLPNLKKSIGTSGNGCPNCSKTGIDYDSTGFLYVLISNCSKYIKIGITNNHERRIRELAWMSRVSFKTYGIKEFKTGKDAKLSESYLHGKFKRAGFHGFNGATEWFLRPDSMEIIDNELNR